MHLSIVGTIFGNSLRFFVTKRPERVFPGSFILVFSRFDSLLMDITRNLFLRLDKEKIPLGLLSSLYPDEKDSVDTSLSIDSVSNCLEVLQRYHENLDTSDISSSDSDSDPEGGELPDIGYRAEPKLTKKKSKRRRADKAFEERVQKLTQKRQVNVDEEEKLSPRPTHISDRTKRPKFAATRNTFHQ